jgi:hypothetical protein
MMCVEQTPFGPLHVLYDGEAMDYMSFQRYAEEFSKRRRLLVGELLFGEFEEIANPTHQKLLNFNEMILGVYETENETNNIFPTTLRADLPAYLVRGKRSFTCDNLDRLGFSDRARELGVYDQLEKANITPHGAGLTILGVSDVAVSFEVNGVRYFKLTTRNNFGELLISDVNHLPFAYRNTRVIEKAVDLGMCEIVAELRPECVLKI